MKRNIGKTDKTVRIIVGIVIILLGILFKSWWGIIGVIPIITAVIGWCPVYLPFGISTCKIEDKSEKAESDSESQ